jgi:hypothetical protein
VADFHVEMASNVAPDGGGGVGSVTDQQQDDGYVNVLLNGQIVQTVTVPAGSEIDTVITVPKLTYGYQEGWQLQASNNVYFKVDGADLQQGTSAGFSQQEVTAYRGGSDGSVTMGVDGPTRGEWPIYLAMPASGVLNLNGTPDDQLPSDANGNQPYFTITGPSTISLDEADSHPELGFNVYTLPAYSTPITFHMVTPYWGQDYNDGISVSVLPQQPPGNAIPVSAGWYNVNASTFWAPNAGPRSVGLVLSPADPSDDPTTNAEASYIQQQASLMESNDQNVADNARSALQAYCDAHGYQHVHDLLYNAINAASKVAAKNALATIDLHSFGEAQHPLMVDWIPNDSNNMLTAVNFQPNGVDYYKVEFDCASMKAHVALPAGQNFAEEGNNYSILTPQQAMAPLQVYLSPLSVGHGYIKITITEMGRNPGGFLMPNIPRHEWLFAADWQVLRITY